MTGPSHLNLIRFHQGVARRKHWHNRHPVWYQLRERIYRIMAMTSFANNASSNQGNGPPISSAEAVLNELKREAERKASIKMFYAAADVFRDYKGPFASESATERQRLAAEYQQRGQEAEARRWGTGSGATPPSATEPVRPSPPVVRPKPSPPIQQTAGSPVPRPTPRTEPTRKETSSAQVQGGQITFPCRWCHETISADLSRAGKLMPCPKCELLVSVPKIPA